MQPTLEEMKSKAAEVSDKVEREQAEMAELIEKTPLLELEGPEPAKTEGEPSETIPEPAKPEPKPAPVDTVSKADYEKLEHRINVLQGMLNKEGRAKELADLNARIAALATENEALKKTAAAAKPAVENDEDMEALRQEFGEEAVNRLVRQNRRMTEEMIREILGPVTEEVGALKTGITKSAAQLYDEKLLLQMPDAYEIGNSREFAAWLEENDWLDVFKTAHANHNVNKVLDKLAKYKATLAPVPDLAADEEKAERERLLAEQAAGPGAGRGAKQPAPDKKIWTRAEKVKFETEYFKGSAGRYYKDGKPLPAAKAMYDDLVLAIQEGRVS